MLIRMRLPLVLLGMALAGPAWSDCQAIYQRAKDADLATLETLYQEARNTPDCDDAFRARLGQRASNEYLRQIQARLRQDPGADVAESLDRALSYARSWQGLAMRGDLRHDRRDDYQAAVDYQEALEIIADRSATPDPPAPALIGALYKKAERSRLLADRYPPTPTNRSTGEPAGLAATSIRGFVPERVALPITFEYDATAFDAKGQAAAADLLDFLTRQGQREITLIGHTDPRGEDAYNLALSQRRAEAVKRFLLAQRYAGAIHTEGRGEAEPLTVDDPQAYSQDELYRLQRRVELRRH
ncbi:MAG: OmpA family protein [Candidatus Competibacter sp.]